MELRKIKLITSLIQYLSFFLMIPITFYLLGMDLTLTPRFIFLMVLTIVIIIIAIVKYLKSKNTKKKKDFDDPYKITDFEEKRKLVFKTIGVEIVVIFSIVGILLFAAQFGAGPLLNEIDKKVISISDLEDNPDLYLNQSVWIKGIYSESNRILPDWCIESYFGDIIELNFSSETQKNQLTDKENYYFYGKFLKYDEKDEYYLKVTEVKKY